MDETIEYTFMIYLENWCYRIEMGPGIDTWRLYGQAFGHPDFKDGTYLFPSTPKSFMPESRIVTTSSGKQYKLGKCDGNETEQIGYLMESIQKGGFVVQ